MGAHCTSYTRCLWHHSAHVMLGEGGSVFSIPKDASHFVCGYSGRELPRRARIGIPACLALAVRLSFYGAGLLHVITQQHSRSSLGLLPFFKAKSAIHPSF